MLKLQITPKQNIFFCSDPHYGQVGIVRGTSSWEGKRGCRDFETVEEHNQKLVDNINNTVGKDDILFCLGDWSFGNYKDGENVSNIQKFREQLQVKEIHLVYGNHDTEIRSSKELQSLFTSVQDYLELQISEFSTIQGIKAFKQHICMSHYAMRVWNKSFHGSWMLYGHSHGSLDEFTPITANPQWIGDQYYIKSYRTMDVGFDCHKGFKPYSYAEIKEIMSQRDVTLEVDHHK